jgi:hypothetical protein
MAWEKRGQCGERTYYYRSIYRDGRVRKLYYGAGSAGKLAADVDALRRAERKVEQEALRAWQGQLDAAMTLNRDLSRGCEVLAAATLLAAGFHRPCRHAWRIWIDGRRTL